MSEKVYLENTITNAIMQLSRSEELYERYVSEHRKTIEKEIDALAIQETYEDFLNDRQSNGQPSTQEERDRLAHYSFLHTTFVSMKTELQNIMLDLRQEWKSFFQTTQANGYAYANLNFEIGNFYYHVFGLKGSAKENDYVLHLSSGSSAMTSISIPIESFNDNCQVYLKPKRWS